MSIVYLNGEYLPLEEAKISVLDRGFTFADAVYEVIPVIQDRVFRFAEHMRRLHNSLDAIAIEPPLSETGWAAVLADVLKKNRETTIGSLYIQVSRGVSERDHLSDQGLRATVFVMAREQVTMDWKDGVRAITHRDIRWDYCYIKSTALLANVMLKQAAREKGAKEAILIRDGLIKEGASSNVFIVSQNVVATPVKDGSILPGVTRDLLVELLQQAGKTCEERNVDIEEFGRADEIWISSSTMGLAPVVVVDARMVGDGRPGPVWHEANGLLQAFRKEYGLQTDKV